MRINGLLETPANESFDPQNTPTPDFGIDKQTKLILQIIENIDITSDKNSSLYSFLNDQCIDILSQSGKKPNRSYQ